MMWNTKRGVSPTVATMLLIAIALVLAVIILIWMRSFVSEKLQKDLGNGAEPIESVCEKVSFDAETILAGSTLEINVVNTGNVPLYELSVSQKKLGSIKNFGIASFDFTGRSVLSGETRMARLPISNNLDIGDTLVIYPVILGEREGTTKGYPCEAQGIETTVKTA